MLQDRLVKYLFQTVAWERMAGVDVYGKPKYDPPVSVKARKQQSFKMVRNMKGDEVVSTTLVHCVEDVKPQDKIDGVAVISVADMVDGGGRRMGVRVYL